MNVVRDLLTHVPWLRQGDESHGSAFFTTAHSSGCTNSLLSIILRYQCAITIMQWVHLMTAQIMIAHAMTAHVMTAHAISAHVMACQTLIISNKSEQW